MRLKCEVCKIKKILVRHIKVYNKKLCFSCYLKLENRHPSKYKQPDNIIKSEDC